MFTAIIPILCNINPCMLFLLSIEKIKIKKNTGLAHYGYALPIMTVKNVYRRMLQSLIKQPTSQNKIEILLASLNIDWPQIYMIPQKVTIESALRIFQYKILTNTLYLNKRTSKFNTAVSPYVHCALGISYRKAKPSIFTPETHSDIINFRETGTKKHP